MKTNVYIRFGDSEYLDINTLSNEEKKRVGNLLNQQAADKIVLIPKTA